MKGFKMQQNTSKKDQIRTLEAEVKNSQVAARMSQLLIQQLMSNMKAMSEDLSNAIAQLYELQYKYEAMRKLSNIDLNNIALVANELRLKDFEEAAEKQDLKDKLYETDTVEEQSTIILTSTAKDENGVDKGIFRSRLKLSESGSPELIKALLGKKLGDKVTVKLNGLDHLVELLSVKKTENTQELSH